jgi:hypothetical protein
MSGMEHNTTQFKALTRAEVKREMRRRKGFTFASYSRLIKRHRSTVTNLADGKIGGDLRERFLKFFGFTEDDIPLRTVTALREREQIEKGAA